MSNLRPMRVYVPGPVGSENEVAAHQSCHERTNQSSNRCSVHMERAWLAPRNILKKKKHQPARTERTARGTVLLSTTKVCALCARH
jgi:hypothetical protein